MSMQVNVPSVVLYFRSFMSSAGFPTSDNRLYHRVMYCFFLAY